MKILTLQEWLNEANSSSTEWHKKWYNDEDILIILKIWKTYSDKCDPMLYDSILPYMTYFKFLRKIDVISELSATTTLKEDSPYGDIEKTAAPYAYQFEILVKLKTSKEKYGYHLHCFGDSRDRFMFLTLQNYLGSTHVNYLDVHSQGKTPIEFSKYVSDVFGYKNVLEDCINNHTSLEELLKNHRGMITANKFDI
jgi:hypothetical protein